jgi:uncharacterized protein
MARWPYQSEPGSKHRLFRDNRGETRSGDGSSTIDPLRSSTALPANTPHHVTHPDQTTRVLLDTNVCLDLWLFEQASVAPLRAAIEDQRFHLVGSTATRDELAHVLARRAARQGPAACRWLALTTQQKVLQSWCDAHGMGMGMAVGNQAHDVAEPRGAPRLTPPTLSLATPQCSDPDDQKFIDLAIQQRVSALLTRDKAVLKLTRRMKAHGVAIDTPERWWATAMTMTTKKAGHDGPA